MADRPVVLVDTNAIIEAVRTGCWPAIAKAFRVETVDECYDECLQGDSLRPSYVKVTKEDLGLLADRHKLTPVERAKLAIECDCSDGLDDGERDLLAHAIGRPDTHWVLCSPDKASIRAAVSLGCHEQLISIGELAVQVGARPNPPLYDHHTEVRLQQWRTSALLGTL